MLEFDDKNVIDGCTLILSQFVLSLFMHWVKKIRYNPVLEAVVTYTEDLAYKQAKEADKLLTEGVYLGTSSVSLLSFIPSILNGNSMSCS